MFKWFLTAFLVLSSADARTFQAIRKPEHLQRRDVSLFPRFEGLLLAYADDAGMVATTALEPQDPMVILEDLETKISSVACSEAGLLVHFHDAVELDTAFEAWNATPSFIVVTSHHHCHISSQHTAWQISSIDIRHEAHALALRANVVPIRKVTRHLSVDIQHFKSTNTLQKRHLARKASTISTNTSTLSSTRAATFSYPSPTASPTGATLSDNISFSRINTTLLPPDSSIIRNLPYVSALDNIRLSCKNCSLNGNVELTAGGFMVTPDGSDFDTAWSFINDGYLEFDATDLAANMVFELDFLPGFNVLDFTARLPSIPLGAIDIGGLFVIGPVLDLTFPISITLNSPINFTTGFKLSAPPVVKIHLNVSDPEASYTSGFSESRVEAIPFSANTKTLSMNFTAAFKPQLVLAAGVGSKQVGGISMSGGIGVYLDLPSFTATFDSLDNVDMNCRPAKSNAFDGLIRLTPSVTYDGGAEWDLSATIEGENIPLGGQQYPWASNTTLLPTQCLMWDPKASVLANAAEVQKADSGSQKNMAAELIASRWVIIMTGLIATSLVFSML